MVAWEVRQKAPGWGTQNFNYVLLDIVFFDDDCDSWYVKNSLVNHDGYPSDILVRKQKKNRNAFTTFIG